MRCDGNWSTWASSDGREWHESKLGLDYNDALEGRVLATVDGWELLMAERGLTTRRSLDGSAWQAPLDVGFGPSGCCPNAGVSTDGTRLVADHLGVLIASTDGRSWREVDPPFSPPSPGGDATGKDWLEAVASPTGSTPWVLVTSRRDGSDATSWTSTDLRTWAHASFALPAITNLSPTRLGLVATGSVPCTDSPVTSRPCPAVAPTQYLSTDGLTWSALGSSVDARYTADGPAGVIAIGRKPEDAPSLTAWVLRDHPTAGWPTPAGRFTLEEGALVNHLRADAQVACDPKREGNPPGLVAAIQCAVDSALVSRVFVYRFASATDAARTYFERLAESGVAPVSGDCEHGSAGERATYPGDDDRPGIALSIEYGGKFLITAPRIGCFSESGMANVRVTCPYGAIYIGIIGKTDDLAALSRWAMEFPGGVPEPIPSPPGVCVGPG
jgi:hypothetical protein